jgi:DNA repair exonuclease SbcCD ATPase subunit
MADQPPTTKPTVKDMTDDEFSDTYRTYVEMDEPPATEEKAPDGGEPAETPPASEPEKAPDFASIAESVIPELMLDEPELEAPPARTEPSVAEVFAELRKQNAEEAKRSERRESQLLKELRRREGELEDTEDVRRGSALEDKINAIVDELTEIKTHRDDLKRELESVKEKEKLREQLDARRELDSQARDAENLADALAKQFGEDPLGRSWVSADMVIRKFDDLLRASPKLQRQSLRRAAREQMPKIAEKLWLEMEPFRTKAKGFTLGAPSPPAEKSATPPAKKIAKTPSQEGTQTAEATGNEVDISSREAREAPGGFWDRINKKYGFARGFDET